MNKNIYGKISIIKDRHGNVVEKIYYNKDMDIHRDNGPAIVWYFRDGKIDTEIYMKNGRKHREGGPAVIIYDSNGEMYSESFWINGVQLNEELQIEICKML